jgi:nitrite reductase (NADH) small subunit
MRAAGIRFTRTLELQSTGRAKTTPSYRVFRLLWSSYFFRAGYPCYVAGVSPHTRIASVAELPPEGELRAFALGPVSVCVANAGGVFTALGNACSHRGAPLSAGCIADGKLVCYWHGWEFHLSDGTCAGPGRASVERFELVIRGDDVYLKS